MLKTAILRILPVKTRIFHELQQINAPSYFENKIFNSISHNINTQSLKYLIKALQVLFSLAAVFLLVGFNDLDQLLE